MTLTDSQLEEILSRSRNGESVARVIRMMDLDLDNTLHALKPYHDKLKEAKAVFRGKRNV